MPRELFPHQKKALKYALGRSSIALIMRMRLGKSLVAIRWAKQKTKKKSGRVLVISPATTLAVWKKELELEGIRAVALCGSSRRKMAALASTTARWVLVNPEGVRACPDLLRGQWAAVILDETGGWFRNPKAKIVKLLRRKAGTIPHRAILTGLADPQGPQDWFEQLAFVEGSFMGCRSFWAWRPRVMRPGFHNWEVTPRGRKRIRNEMRKIAFTMTEKQAGLFVPKVYEQRRVELPAKFRRLYTEARRDMTLGELSTKTIPTALGWLGMLSGGIVPKQYGKERSKHKTKELVALLKGELAKEPVVVWANYVGELKLIKAELGRAKIPVEIVFGEQSLRERAKTLQRFAAGKLRVVVIQCRVGQYALNLSTASTQIFYSNSWDWSVRGQAEKRCDHITKKRPTLIIDLVTADSIDEKVLKVLRGKKKSSAFFMNALASELGKGR